jgi:hypothetical protein
MQSRQYYTCSPSAKAAITGTWPQVNDFESGAMPIGDFIQTLLPDNWNTVPPSISLSMSFKAKWTDLMSSFVTPGYVGMLVSDRAKALLQNYHLPPHRWVGMDVFGTDRSHRNYAVLNYDWDCPAIDYPNSEFLDEIEETSVHFETYQDWLTLNKVPPAPPLIIPTRLVLHSPMDLLLIPFSTQVIFSERLKNAIEASSLTGFEFESITMEVFLA